MSSHNLFSGGKGKTYYLAKINFTARYSFTLQIIQSNVTFRFER